MPITVISFPLASSILKLAWSMCIAVLPVVVKTNDGDEIQGGLGSIGESSIELVVDGDAREIAFEDLASLRPQSVEQRTGPTVQVTLVNGSRVAAQDLNSVDNELVIEPRRQNAVRIPFKQVKAIRFRSPAAATDAQWLGIVEREQRGDTLVIRRPGDRLDPQQGIIVAAKSDVVEFDLEGTKVNAPVERLEGVTFGGTDPVNDDFNILVTDVYGSSWAAVAIVPGQGDQPLRLRFADAIEHEIPLHQLAEIRWSGGVVFLAGETPASIDFRPTFASSISSELQNAMFGPSIDGEADLRMHGSSKAEYRVERGYQTLSGSVQRHETVDNSGSVTVRIELDGNTVWEQSLDDDAPRGFEIPIESARRLAFHVDSDGDGELGDTVRIVRPRLLK